MSTKWLIYIIIGVMGAFLDWLFQKLGFLKSKTLRIFVAIIVSSLICWLIYDLAIAS